MQNFNDILNGVSDGTKDLSINALTLAGALTANGNVTLGNASGDDLTVTASLASSIPIKTNNSYDIGSATLGLRKLYLGNGGAGATCDIISASHAKTREYRVPDCGAAANFLMSELAQSANGVKTFNNGIKVASGGSTLASYVEAGTFTPTLKGGTTNPTTTYTTQTGVYTRIGNVVFVTVTLVTNNLSVAGSGFAYIDVSGIGINSNASSTKRYSFSCRVNAFNFPASNTQIVGEMVAADYIVLSGTGSNVANDIDVAQIGSGDSIFLTGFYFV